MRLLRPFLPLSTPGWVRRPLETLIGRFVHGPSDHQEQAGARSVPGRVRNGKGRTVSATLETPAGYLLTVLTALAALEKVLAGAAPVGFATPAKAFGPDIIRAIPGTDFRWETANY